MREEAVSQDMSKHRSKAGAACLSVPFINMEWSRPWAVSGQIEGVESEPGGTWSCRSWCVLG